jgi:hypothetical protein
MSVEVIYGDIPVVISNDPMDLQIVQSVWCDNCYLPLHGSDAYDIMKQTQNSIVDLIGVDLSGCLLLPLPTNRPNMPGYQHICKYMREFSKSLSSRGWFISMSSISHRDITTNLIMTLPNWDVNDTHGAVVAMRGRRRRCGQFIHNLWLVTRDRLDGPLQFRFCAYVEQHLEFRSIIDSRDQITNPFSVEEFMRFGDSSFGHRVTQVEMEAHDGFREYVAV